MYQAALQKKETKPYMSCNNLTTDLNNAGCDMGQAGCDGSRIVQEQNNNPLASMSLITILERVLNVKT